MMTCPAACHDYGRLWDSLFPLSITMNRLSLFFLSLLLAVSSLAQVSGGYYRVQNFATSRYIVMIDNKSKGYDTSKQKADIDALLSVKPFSRVANDPSSVIYIEDTGSNQYVLKAQGTNSYNSIGYYLALTKVKSGDKYYYKASATASGITLYLYDVNTSKSESKLSTGGNTQYGYWDIQPISSSDESNYFGLQPEFTVSGQRFTSLYASFPFTFASSGLKAYTVSKLDGDLAIWQELSGKVAAGTPVIIQCAGADASSNRLNLEMQDGNKPSANLLQGVYFNNNDVTWIAENVELWKQGQGNLPYHFNATPYDSNTMRLLGVTSSGKLGFVKSNEEYIPRNRAYINVPAGSPDEITLVTQAEYDAIIAADKVTVTANNKQRAYGDANPTFDYTVEGTLKGQPVLTCDAVQASGVGTYPIVVSKGTVTNRVFNGVNGTLTVSKAPVTVTARSYTIKQNEELPRFAADFAGFKLGEGSSVLTQQPTLSCNAPADKTPGTYTITVSGAAAQNYDFSYVAGTLTIQPADPITVTATSLTKTYGDAVPQLSYTITGGQLTGTPQLECAATESSVPGTYDIIVSKGSLQDYPNLVFVPGVLTVERAPLIISAGGPYTMKQTDPRPEFVAVYEGFKLGQTETVLTQLPVLTTNAPDDNAPGEYDVIVSGAAADNYDISYQNGRLIIAEADQIVVVAADAVMVYGDEVPQLTYTVTGGELQGEPVLTCEATSLSQAGTYDIVVAQGTLSYPNLKLVNGMLTIQKAPLIAAVGNYTREEGEENPEFEIVYEGFRNGDTPAVFITAPVATTEATIDSTIGDYPIVISGGEAQSYEFTYVDGRLTVSGRSALQAVVVFAQPADVYSLTGRLVRSQVLSTAGLPRGVYVVNGRKLVVK